jgi:Co/Zn/Cd efflux system component
MAGCGCEIEAKNRREARVLVWLLAINAVMFCVEIVAGYAGQSTALIADSLDMFADASVYAVGLYAVGRSLALKVRAATLSGVLQVLLGFSALADVLRRLVAGSVPASELMIGVGLLAFVANVVCLALIAGHRRGDVHMRASWIFSRNDVIANAGVIAGGFLVHYLDTALPDLIIGFAIVLVVISGGVHILRDARAEARAATG